MGARLVQDRTYTVHVLIHSVDAFMIEVCWNFDKMQTRFKAITRSFGHAFWWETTVLQSMETLLDTCLVALESISCGKGIYYGTLRCHTLPSKENFPRQWLAPWSDPSLACTVLHFPSQLPVIVLNMFCILSKFHHTSIMKASVCRYVHVHVATSLSPRAFYCHTW